MSTFPLHGGLGVLGVALVLAANESNPATEEFSRQVAGYLKLRADATKNVAPIGPKATPEEIHANQEVLRKVIRRARQNARVSDLFTPAVQKHVVAIIRSEMKGKAGEAARLSVQEGNPAVEAPSVKPALKVNAAYPNSAPLSMVPPTLLLRLPELPKELDYRFVGNHLILRDTGANLILDYIPNAIR